MTKATITVNTDNATKDALAAAAEAAGLPLSGYLLKAAKDKMIRDAAVRYRQVMAEHPDFATEVAAGRAAMQRSAERVRAQVLAKYDSIAV